MSTPLTPDSASKRKVMQSVFIGIVILLAGIILFSLSNFIDAALGAVMIYVLCHPLMTFLVEKKKWKRTYAAVLMLLTSFFIVMIPAYIMIQLFVPKVSLFFGDTSLIFHFIDRISRFVTSKTGMNLMNEANLKTLQSEATGYFTSILSGTFNTLGKIAVMYFILYYLLINAGKTEEALEQFIPMSRENIARFSGELKAQTYSNAIGAPILAIVQGLLAGIGYWIFGLSEPVFWGVMTGFFSFAPVIGTMLIWLPAGIYQLSLGLTWQGIGILIFGLLVIGTVDNIFRFTFQKKFADVHPLITVLGVIMGIELFGIPGIIFGPLLISYFLILLKIYKEEYMEQKIILPGNMEK